MMPGPFHEDDPELDSYGFRLESEDELELFTRSRADFDRQVSLALPQALLPCRRRALEHVCVRRCVRGRLFFGLTFCETLLPVRLARVKKIGFLAALLAAAGPQTTSTRGCRA